MASKKAAAAVIVPDPTVIVSVPIRMNKAQHAVLKEAAKTEARTLQSVIFRAISAQYPEFSGHDR